MSDDQEDDLEKRMEELQDIIDESNNGGGTDEEGNTNNGGDTNEGDSTNEEDNPNNGGDTEGGDDSSGGDGGDAGDNGDGGDSNTEEEDHWSNNPGFDGVALAYTKKKKNNKKQIRGEKNFAPPGRGKWKSIEGKGKLIGEVLYDWLIEMMEKLIKAMVDIPLDFIDYVLFKSLTRMRPLPKQKEEKKTVFDYGRTIEEGYASKAAKGTAFYKQALQEVLNNVERNKNGEPLEWNTFRNEPRWFQDAVRLEQEATANPNSEAALKWERFKNSDKFVERKLGNEAVYHIIATRIATFNEALHGEEFKLPKNITKKLDEMNKILEKDKISAPDLKTKMGEKINEMRTLVTGGGFVNQTINTKLDEMQRVVDGNEENVAQLKNAFKKPMEQIKDVNPIPERIKTASREDYEKIMQNIDKIKEKYRNNPQREVEVLTAYVNNIIETINKAQEDVIKYEEANRLSKSKIVQNTFGLINRVGERMDRDGRPLINLKTKKEKAENSTKAIKSAIDDFLVENRRISEYTDATRRSSEPDTGKPAMLRRMEVFLRRGSR